MTSKRKEHPQKALSKDWLVRSLIELMKEKPYKEISIAEVASRADLSRRTFYRHFSTIDDVLNCLFEVISEQFAVFYLEQRPVDLQSTIRAYFTYWQQHKGFLIILNDNDMLYLLLQKFLPEVQAKLTTNNETSNSEYVFYFTSGGLWNLLVKWIEDGAKKSPEEMAMVGDEIIKHLVEHG